MTVEPTPTTVGTMYDQFSELLMDMLGGHIHLGYWADPTKDESPEAAGARMTCAVGDRLSPSQGQHILDIGCGTGKATANMARTYGVDVTGISISKHQVEVAQTEYEHTSNSIQVMGRAHFEFADAMNLPFADASFDGAYAIESLVHMSDKRTAIQHIARVLRPGSRLVIADLVLDCPCPDSPVLALYAEIFHIATLISAADFQDLLREAGFRIIDVADIRDKVRPTAKLLKETALSIGGELGQKLTQLATGMEKLQEFGYALITAERL